MLASSVKRRLLGAMCVAALIYSLVVVLENVNRSSDADAFTMSAGAMISDVYVGLTSTAAADYQPVPGSSPALRLISNNVALKNALVACGATVSCNKAALQNANIAHGDSTFVIGPGFSPDTDFQLLSGTQLPTGFRFAGRGGKPGNSASNPVNINNQPDAGTATARVCNDAVTLLVSAKCQWARNVASGDGISGDGPGHVNCPQFYGTNPETTYGFEAGKGIAHIAIITNDMGPNPAWGPQSPAGAGDPKGRLWDVKRQRYAYARWSIMACGGVDIPSLVGNQPTGFMVGLGIFVYKDDPVPGAYTLSLMGTLDSRDQTGPTSNYKACGSVNLGDPPQSNICNGIVEEAISTDFFASNKRIARLMNACGQYDVAAFASDGVTSPGHATASGRLLIQAAGYPSCPTGVRGVVANTATDPTAATVYAFDSSTGAIVNGAGAGTSSSSASVACNGGAMPGDPGVPAGPGPGSSTPPAPGGTGAASYGCANTVGNTGNFGQQSPGWGDGRYYIRTNTGTTYKLMVAPKAGSGLVPRWVGSVAPNSWSSASTYTPSVGGAPLQTGDGSFAGALTNEVVAGTNVSGSVTRNSAWTTGTDAGYIAIYGASSGAVEASTTALSGNGAFTQATQFPSVKVRYEVADGAGNPNLVGWYKATGTPGANFTEGDAVAPGALVTNNFVSGANVTGSLTASGASSSVYVYRNSDGASIYSATADSSGAWTARVPTAASAYKIYAIAPAAANLQPKWYNLQDTYSSATLVSAPSSANDMTLPSASAIQGYTKDASTAADIAGAPVYAYNSSTGAFVSWTTSNASGRYSLNVAAGSYKVLNAGDASHESKWSEAGWSYGDSTAVAAPGTSNFSLRAGGNISGQATQSTVPTANYTITAYTSDGSKVAGNVLSDGSGNYALRVPTTGASGWSYKVRFIPPSGSSSSTRWYSNQTSFGSAGLVTSPSSGINQDTPP